MWYRKQEIIKMDKQIEIAGDDNKNNIGVLYGIGVGPGDPELMTLKAINTIKACDIIAIPAVSKDECYVYGIVPSFCAAAARLGISLGEMMDEIHIIPASYDVRDTVGYGGTCVYMKSGKKLAELIEVLRTGDAIRKKKMTVYGVTNCGMESERVYRGLDELTEAKGYLTIVIVKYS
ncbi:hypothetical protein DW775_14700 [Agathobacter rectalis]|jgi:precorrin-2 methylase|uniref:Tetrapyrrole methylase domain-containing protein n=1 Tax=Agathobacter rectalis TaxID=39491 RepID=A0A396FBZ0_9FIRM|nr:SAM-dependent methyltransferase [Agathobacter rectalis]HCI93767.1 hypothetical protein [Eubacterium sp.]RGZ16683.1 hypothetical protein DXA03_11645 [Agathobacter rectalis]RHA01366.1 hypothetical protein DW951_13645 [Agathobacter rectalis]RHA09561.1 hypothetical protein DW948_13955 [Agathobacter rectalis]RHD90553.1 hypothetical protein DW775_14700 [Agathobacter rectalis]